MQVTSEAIHSIPLLMCVAAGSALTTAMVFSVLSRRVSRADLRRAYNSAWQQGWTNGVASGRARYTAMCAQLQRPPHTSGRAPKAANDGRIGIVRK